MLEIRGRGCALFYFFLNRSCSRQAKEYWLATFGVIVINTVSGKWSLKMYTKSIAHVYFFFNSVHLTSEAPRLMDRHFNINLNKTSY